MNPLVSIVISIFNMEKYLAHCLESAINQTYKNIEIICIDDGSTDRSAEIVSSFAKNDERIKYFYQTNRGLSTVRNEGIKKSHGEYIMFLDSDDFFHSRAVERMIGAAIESKADLVFSEIKYVFNYNVNTEQEITDGSAGEIPFTDLFVKNKCGYYVNGNMYRRDLAQKHEFIPSLKIGEDSVFALQTIIDAEKPVFLNGVCYFYLVRDDSLSRNKNYTMNMSQLIDAAEMCYEIAKRSGYSALNTVYLKGIYRAVFEHRIRCANSEYKKEVNEKLNKVGKKYLHDLYSDKNIPFTERFAVSVAFKMPFMYKVFRAIKDPTMIKVYLRG